MSSLTSFISSFFESEPVHNDAAEEKEEEVDSPAPPPAEAEEEEEDPEDEHPAIREDCKETRCASLAKHFDHCQEKVQAGEGFKGEDCVEELMMHCIDDCAGPKLFAKLR
ncbi:hypothetical protein FA15DRAFT_658311 [Coprinopsis marcescibilis]|uniref:Ubiquinol-cytochrome C reductase hinge domain-containing protein n=1 Tax=Coprinopsis marcescibilis TaxID=230819 RepID=A0A5C3KM86_COPMA|nr:hypothetical protein FA15DRAFT_658311 [Coprinopsis marcescibilis]